MEPKCVRSVVGCRGGGPILAHQAQRKRNDVHSRALAFEGSCATDWRSQTMTEEASCPLGEKH